MFDLEAFITSIDISDTSAGAGNPSPVIGAAPTTLTATADTDSINLEWVDADTYTAVIVMRKTASTDYSALATVAGDATTHNDTTAVEDVEYTYKVRGVKSGFPTPYSNTASDTIVNPPVAATGSVTVDVAASVIAGKILTIGAITYTFGTDITLSVNNNTLADNIADAIDANPSSEVTVSSGDGVDSLTAKVAGSAGNSIVLSTDAVGLTLSGTHLSGGSD